MIFQHTVQNVLNEQKTQTRRVIKTEDSAIRGYRNQIHAVEVNGRLKWEVGRTYAVQTARTEPSIARIQIIKLNSQYVKYISTADAIAEGFSNRQEFLDTWQQIHGENSMDLRVWIVQFKLVTIEARQFPVPSLQSIRQELVTAI